MKVAGKRYPQYLAMMVLWKQDGLTVGEISKLGFGSGGVFVNYTPSPEAHYPVAINQAYAATKGVAEYGKEINVDGERLAVAGNSVGGNMAAVVALMTKDRCTPAIIRCCCGR